MGQRLGLLGRVEPRGKERPAVKAVSVRVRVPVKRGIA